MNIIILDGKTLTNENNVHQFLKEKLDLPPYYGKNLDALWDCLNGWVELPLTVIWKNYEYSKSGLGDFSNELLLLFKDAEKEIVGFKIEIE